MFIVIRNLFFKFCDFLSETILVTNPLLSDIFFVFLILVSKVLLVNNPLLVIFFSTSSISVSKTYIVTNTLTFGILFSLSFNFLLKPCLSVLYSEFIFC